MSRVLLIGCNPPPFLPTAKTEAAHYRTLQFLEPLLEDGHTLCLCAGARGEPHGTIPAVWRDRLSYYPIAFGQRGWRPALQAAHDAFHPDCIVAAGFSHALYATALRRTAPLWLDIYGDQLTIMQAAAFRSGRDRGIGTTVGFMRHILLAGDAFSACGTPQLHALIGELAMSGRLNRHTFGYPLGHVVLPGAPPRSARRAGSERTLLHTAGIGADDFVVLWCGGYNTWTDVDTLFRALEAAMERGPRIHFVSVGGSTYDAADTVYDELRRSIERSPRRSRYHLLGWRPWAETAGYYAESDVGINIDGDHYETTYGTRTRLLEMLAAGLPVVTSRGTELSQLLDGAGAALTFDIGDWRGFSERLLALTDDPALRRRTADAAAAQADGPLSFYTTTAALRAWVAAPRHAPDKLTRQPLREHLEYRLRALTRLALWRLARRE